MRVDRANPASTRHGSAPSSPSTTSSPRRRRAERLDAGRMPEWSPGATGRRPTLASLFDQLIVLPLGFHEWQKAGSIAAYCDTSAGHSGPGFSTISPLKFLVIATLGTLGPSGGPFLGFRTASSVRGGSATQPVADSAAIGSDSALRPMPAVGVSDEEPRPRFFRSEGPHGARPKSGPPGSPAVMANFCFSNMANRNYPYPPFHPRRAELPLTMSMAEFERDFPAEGQYVEFKRVSARSHGRTHRRLLQCRRRCDPDRS